MNTATTIIRPFTAGAPGGADLILDLRGPDGVAATEVVVSGSTGFAVLPIAGAAATTAETNAIKMAGFPFADTAGLPVPVDGVISYLLWSAPATADKLFVVCRYQAKVEGSTFSTVASVTPTP